MYAANPSTAQAQVILDECARNGVRHVVVCPGSRSTALVLAADRHPDLQVHIGIDERSAGFFVLGIARSTRVPTVVITTSGTAVVNLHPAVVEADYGAVPLVVLTADRPPELLDVGANQSIDQRDVFGRHVRWSLNLSVAEDRPESNAVWRSLLCRAVASARGVWSRPGPVQVNVPFREPTVPRSDDGRSEPAPPFHHDTDGRTGSRPWTLLQTQPRTIGSDAVANLTARLAAVKHPVVVVGSSNVDPEAIQRLAGACGGPVIAEATSGARRGPNAVAHADLFLGDRTWLANHHPDLILRIGRPTVSSSVSRLLALDVPHLLIDDGDHWPDATHSTTEVIVADPTWLATQVAKHLRVAAPSAWIEQWRTADRAAAKALQELVEEHPASELASASAIAHAMPAGSNLFVASSQPIRDFERVLPVRADLHVYANRGASGIDGSLSSARGVAVGTGRPTVAVLGDLAALHDRNGWLFDVSEPPFVLVVINNDGGGIFHRLPVAEIDGFERLFATPHGITFEHLAEGHHLTYHRPADPKEAARAIAAGLAQGGPHLVEIVTDRAAATVQAQQLRERVAAAVRHS